MSLIQPKTALVSLSDKTGLNEIVKYLTSKNVKILSTGGTYKAIREICSDVIEVSEFTGFEEMMDGRVKTLHPKIHAGILARRDKDLEVLSERGFEPIDLVIVNLYPFKETIASDCSFEEAIEKIDIGGPTMIRSAAKNFKDVAVLTDPADYAEFINQWENDGGVTIEFREKQAKKVFALMADYNASIANYLSNEDEKTLPNFVFSESSKLRYGENPHQEARLFTFDGLQIKILQMLRSSRERKCHTTILLMLMLHGNVLENLMILLVLLLSMPILAELLHLTHILKHII